MSSILDKIGAAMRAETEKRRGRRERPYRAPDRRVLEMMGVVARAPIGSALPRPRRVRNTPDKSRPEDLWAELDRLTRQLLADNEPADPAPEKYQDALRRIREEKDEDE